MSSLGPSFDRAQRAYDAQMPPDDDDCETDCNLCGGDGRLKADVADGHETIECHECGGSGSVERHQWKRIPGQSNDEISFSRCMQCGKVEES